MPKSMPTLSNSGLFHRVSNRFLLGVNVALGDIHVTVACEISQRPGVHVRRPPGKTSVSKSVKFKILQFHIFPFGFFPQKSGGLRDRLHVLFLE